MSQPKAILLKDYRPPAFQVDTIDLLLDIYPEYTNVTSKLVIHRHAATLASVGDLELLGENMELKKILLNGSELSNSAYSLSSDRVVLHGVKGDKFNLEIHNVIKPHLNTALEGFYQSGSILCTQCEPEGFRKITYFIDRPDVMARFKTTLRGDKKTHPLLLSNGNRIATRDLENGRHEVVWEDPFRKPAYLFAAVAGDLELATDTFKTRSGRTVALEVYVDKGQGYKTGHALRALQNSMKWDEDTFGLEYDLDIYMIVAVESFNFGAMENKGLNIFNSAYVLADPATATDSDFQGVEGVVAHEYFHNWTGNRVTCRDWFQLTLKEGLTVFRDQEFSADMLSRSIKRIEDVMRLREAQFPEDAGPTAHPIRPSSYIEINNFYTATVYEKGAEVIRMIHTLIGDANFKKGITEYFRRHDGQAVTTEDFVAAMEAASGKDLTQFRNWYSRPGTPTLVVRGEFDAGKRQYRVNVRQQYPSVGNERLENNVLHIPFKLALFSPQGKVVADKLMELTRLDETFTIDGVDEMPVPSWNRTFAAPVIVDYPYTEKELLHLVAFDTDAVSRFESLQRVYVNLLTSWVKALSAGKTLPLELPSELAFAMKNIVTDKTMDPAFKAYLFGVPSEAQLNQNLDEAAIPEVHQAVEHLEYLLGKTFLNEWRQIYEAHRDPRKGDLSAAAMASRALKNTALSMLVKGKDAKASEFLADHFFNAQTMSEEATALSLYSEMGPEDNSKALQHFHEKWKSEPLVMMRWFSSQAANSPADVVLARMNELEGDACFRSKVPNDLRALYGAFARNNLVAFHAADGSGYQFMAERIKRIDAFNPQVASRLTSAFSLMPKMRGQQKELMKGALKGIVEGQPSKDVFEMASRYLGA